MALTLVTGTPGWLGTRLVQVLAEGLPDVPALERPDYQRRIRCLVLSGSNASVLRRISTLIDVCKGDLCNSTDMRTFCQNSEGATLFHCAGVIHPMRSVREFFEVNVDGTRHLLQMAESAGVRRVIVVSSNSPIGTNPHSHHIFDERSPYNPYMGYGHSKMLMERIVCEFQTRGKLETVIIRPPWFYGPGQPPRQTFFFSMIKNGMVPVVGSGENRRSMAYIDNICQGLLLCEKVPSARGQVYWIADRQPYTMNEIVETVERLLETEFNIPVAHRRLRLPDIVGKFAWLGDWLLQHAGIYHQNLHVLSEMNKTIVCSIAKAEAELGYDPKVELEEGMRRSLRWCLEQGLKI